MDFTDLVNLASERLGGSAIAANDEFFAARERLVMDAAPVFVAGRYDEHGKWMDGWETRRRREHGYDWCLVRLGLPGVVHGVVVDTANFTGNYPEACSIDGACVAGYPDVQALLSAGTTWREILPRSILKGDARNPFAIHPTDSITHVRLNIFPDGGVARLRVHGLVRPDWSRLVARPELDLASVEHGGLVVATSDKFYGHPNNLILPGLPLGMADGWETKRRRGPGHDWAIIELGRSGRLHRVEVDTRPFIGNAPGRCSIDVCDAPGCGTEALLASDRAWQVLLPETHLEPNTRHVFDRELRSVDRASHARFTIVPDGGVGRLRLYGTISEGD